MISFPRIFKNRYFLAERQVYPRGQDDRDSIRDPDESMNFVDGPFSS